MSTDCEHEGDVYIGGTGNVSCSQCGYVFGNLKEVFASKHPVK